MSARPFVWPSPYDVPPPRRRGLLGAVAALAMAPTVAEATPTVSPDADLLAACAAFQHHHAEFRRLGDACTDEDFGVDDAPVYLAYEDADQAQEDALMVAVGMAPTTLAGCGGPGAGAPHLPRDPPRRRHAAVPGGSGDRRAAARPGGRVGGTGMSATFDFQALAARASADNPDAVLLQTVERLEDARRALDKAKRHNRAALHAVRTEAEAALIGLRPTTPEGAAAKLRAAAGTMWRCPGFNLRITAMREAADLLVPPQPRRGRRVRRGAA